MFIKFLGVFWKLCSLWSKVFKLFRTVNYNCKIARKISWYKLHKKRRYNLTLTQQVWNFCSSLFRIPFLFTKSLDIGSFITLYIALWMISHHSNIQFQFANWKTHLVWLEHYFLCWLAGHSLVCRLNSPSLTGALFSLLDSRIQWGLQTELA